MTDFREKAREIKAAGQAERGNFEASGVPLRMYNYWLNNSNSKRATSIKNKEMRENFCHFWRVVAIWAPLMFVVRHILNALEDTRVLVGVGISALVLLIWGGVAAPSFGSFILALLVIILAAVGVFSGVFKGSGFLDPNDEEDIVFNKVCTYGMIIPTAWVVFGVAKAVKAIHANWKPEYSRIFATGSKFVGIAVAVAAVVGLIVAVFLSYGWTGLLIGLIGIISTIVFIAILAFVMCRIEDFVRGRRSVRITQRRQMIANMTSEEFDAYMAAEEEPGKVAKFFRGIGDFFILIAQVVRVNKWKICPMVEIETK